MVGNRVIRIMQDITFKMFHRSIIQQYDFIMWIRSSPPRNSPVERAYVGVRIPASMADKFTAIVAAAVHPVSTAGKILLDFSDGIRQAGIPSPLCVPAPAQN